MKIRPRKPRSNTYRIRPRHRIRSPTLGYFPNPLHHSTLPPKSRPDALKTHIIALDFDKKINDPEHFVSHTTALLSSLLSTLSLPPIEEIHYETSTNGGLHIRYTLSAPITLRENLALRLLLNDDPLHVAYDLFASLYSPRFPTNVLFTRKGLRPLHPYREDGIRSLRSLNRPHNHPQKPEPTPPQP